MATILVYNQDTNRIERYNRGPNEAMPYVTGNTLTVKEFRGSSGSDIMWTTKAFMEAWNSLRRQWGKPIYVGYAFKRIWQGGHSGMSQHYAGLAMDAGFDFLAVDRAFAAGKRMAHFKHGDLPLGTFLQQFVGGKDAAGTCADDHGIELHRVSPCLC